MSKHTPGPWRIGKDPFSFESVNFGGIGKVFEPIAGGNKFKEDVAIAEANAHLIAAAPELLEACKVMADWCNSHLGQGKEPECTDLLASAIAKAEDK